MGAKHVRRLPVIDSAGKLCGLLSMDDVARKIADNPHAAEPGEQEIYAALESIYGQRAKIKNTSQTPQSTKMPGQFRARFEGETQFRQSGASRTQSCSDQQKET